MIEIINESSPIDEPGQFDDVSRTILGFFKGWCERSDLPSPVQTFPPTFLLDEASFAELAERYLIEDEDYDDQRATEWLGLYIRERSGCNFTAKILLCPERMMTCVNGDEHEYRMLFTKVLIHELAHAVMDYCMENRSFVG